MRFHSALDARIRELAICVAARHVSNQFEWVMHAPLAVKAGVSPEAIEALRQGARPRRLAPDEEDALDFAQELLNRHGVSDPTYQLRALQAQALGYLLKPVELELLDATIERAWSIHAYRAAREEYDGKVRTLIESASQGFGRIVGRKAGRLLLLDPEDVCYFWIDAGIVRARTAEDSFWVNHAIGELEAALSAKGFFRAHRSALVNLNKVAEIRPDVRSSFQLLMKDRDRSVIDVSERQARQLRTLIPGL